MARPLRFPTIAVVISLALTAAVVAAGTFLRTPHHDDSAPASGPATPTATPTATPLAEPLTAVDTTTLTVQRAPFCDRMATADLATALGGPVQHAASYQPGGRAAAGGHGDVGDEYGCSWRSGHRTAQAWVFAPPVTPGWARQLAGTTPAGCHAVPDLTYGAPSTALRCGRTIRLAGLFGDAWLTCTLATTDADLAGRFCLAVARAAA